ncbi:MAG: DUF2318 domain-containing protein [Deltaproteobacteria bacterium]|jgi:uncharacterized membrane protein|nr:DUF2318 domain-containing protein [Deltaproteobacteria bacterium]
MLFYFLSVLDNTWYLAVGLFLVFLVLLGLLEFDRGRKWRRLVLGGFLLGFLAALTLAVLRRKTGWVVREYYDLAVLWPLAVSLLAFIFVYPTPQDRFTASSPLTVYFGALVVAFSAALALPNLLLYPLDFGAGLDSVFNLDYLFKAAGYVLGLMLLLALSLGLLSQARRVPKNLLRPFLLAGFLVFLALILLKMTQIMTVRGMLPGSRQITRAVIFFLEHENFFFFGQMLIWGLLAAVQMIRARLTRPFGPNPAVIRRVRANLRFQFGLGSLVIAAIVMCFVSVTGLRAYQNRGPFIEEPVEVFGRQGLIELDLGTVGDGNLHRQQFKTESGTPVRFIVIRKSENAYGVGLDACDICGQSGYYQRGDQVVCKLCDVVMNKVTIGFPGGCNPVPLDFSILGGKLLVKVEDLEREKERFR